MGLASQCAKLTGTKLAASVGANPPVRSFSQRNNNGGLIPCRRATAETFVHGTEASATMAAFSVSLHRRRVSDTISKPREKLSPDISLDQILSDQPSPTKACLRNQTRRPSPDAYDSSVVAVADAVQPTPTPRLSDRWGSGPCAHSAVSSRRSTCPVSESRARACARAHGITTDSHVSRNFGTGSETKLCDRRS